MARTRTRGLTTATAATADHGVFAVWNPSATKRIRLLEFGLCALTAPVAGAGFYFRRISARGTPASTVTPVAANVDENDTTPVSGWLLDLGAYSVQPTLVAGPLPPGWVLSAVIGSGLIYPWSGIGIQIPPGTGLLCANRAALVHQVDEISVVVDD